MIEYKGWERHFLIFPMMMWNETYWLQYIYRKYYRYDTFWIPRGSYRYATNLLDVLKHEGDA